MSIHEWMDKESVAYEYNEYSSAFKKKEILLYSTTRMDLEDIMLSAISLPQKNKYCMISIYIR